MPLWPIVSWFTGSRVGRWISAVLAAGTILLLATLNMRRTITRNVNLQNEVERLRGATEADKRMDHADTGLGASDDDNRDWLRERGAKRR